MSDRQERPKSIFMEPLVPMKTRKKRAKHPIFIYSARREDADLERLNQIVNIYEHTLDDYIVNSLKIVKHFKRSYGDQALSYFTLGQTIRFRVYEGQTPIDLSLFKFFINYTALLIPMLMGADMHNWHPFNPPRFTTKAWVAMINKLIRMSRPFGTVHQIDELIEWTKFLCNQYVEIAGDRFGLSISNNEFLEVAARSKDAYESMTCTFKIPKNISPGELEDIARNRTSHLLNTISEQSDLSISTFTKNGLFNPGQFREFAVHEGHKPDLYGNTIPFTSNTNIIMGLNDIKAFVVDGTGGRKAETLKLNVSDAGALERAMCMLLSGIRYVDTGWECDSQHFRIKTIDSLETLNKLEGRVGTLDPKSDEYFILDPEDDGLIGQTVYLKTPITCTHPHRQDGVICSACYGKLMAHMNCDIHVGRLAALNSADDMEQTLLSAKHALSTNTNDVEFDTMFSTYFDAESCQIFFNESIVTASADDPEEFSHLYLEFHLGSMIKRQDGEGRNFDRMIPDIVIYDDRDDSRIIIQEKNGIPIFLSPEFNEFFLDAAKHTDIKGTVRVPFTDLIDQGKILCDILFEYQYKNQELAGALLELEGILNNGSLIRQFRNYDECLRRIIPLFVRGGIHLPELQFELLVAMLIYRPDGGPVDWTLENPEYQFCSIDKSIQNNPSLTTSVLYHESSRQLAGAYGFYEKSKPSDYDWFLLD